MNFESALSLARHILDAGKCSPDEAANNPAIPNEYRREILKKLQEEETIELHPAMEISGETGEHAAWLTKENRSEWYYWPRTRNYLLTKKKWPLDRIRSLDDSSDKVLQHLSPPEEEQFGKRGLVIGYIQSGKTANYTALIAKAVDVGYRLFIVLTGMDKGLRRQTQIRLEQELVGYARGARQKHAVEFPPPGKQWHVFTENDTEGDFQPGFANTAALQGTQPVLLVVKKNTHVLDRIMRWLSNADVQTIQKLPVLVIDDEGDQASIDTAGARMIKGADTDEDYEPPSAINKKIRKLLNKFTRYSFVSYTATPYANVLIPVDQYNPDEGPDLYPKDFIIALPRPRGYFGAERLFGMSGSTGKDNNIEEGLNVFRSVPEEDMEQLNKEIQVPPSLQMAILDFALAGSAKAWRDSSTDSPDESPATMLVHISHLVTEHDRIAHIVREELSNIRDEWRYNKADRIRNEMKKRWQEDFEPVTREINPLLSIGFEELEKEKYIDQFLESIDIRVINSKEGDILNYDEDPSLKAIIIGGNKLSRGLTIEGLLISYFTRRAQITIYDTVMQMGRWFGYREGYADLTRIYTTDKLADMFSHMALVEHLLREDINIYSSRRGITPKNFGMRILTHPSMYATNLRKQRFALKLKISYSGALFQTYRFPLDDPEELAHSADKNLQFVKELLSGFGRPPQQEKNHLIWEDISPEIITDFLGKIENSEHKHNFEHIKRYIEDRKKHGELIRWTVAVSQLQKRNEKWGCADWGINMDINQISRTRLLKKSNSLGVITDPKDENIGLSEDQIERARKQLVMAGTENKPISSVVKRVARSHEEGLLILYPISKYSAPVGQKNKNRTPLYSDPNNKYARNLIGVAIPFPESRSHHPEIYIHGTPGWGSDDE